MLLVMGLLSVFELAGQPDAETQRERQQCRGGEHVLYREAFWFWLGGCYDRAEPEHYGHAKVRKCIEVRGMDHRSANGSDRYAQEGLIQKDFNPTPDALG